MNPIRPSAVIVTLVLLFSVQFAGAAEYRIGVLAKNGPAKAMKKRSATAEYLSEKLEGDSFAIVPLEFGGKHDNVVYAVQNGEVDAGTVRTDTLERMAAAGDIDMSEFKVINAQSTAGFPFVLSTTLYPRMAVRQGQRDLATDGTAGGADPDGDSGGQPCGQGRQGGGLDPAGGLRPGGGPATVPGHRGLQIARFACGGASGHSCLIRSWHGQGFSKSGLVR